TTSAPFLTIAAARLQDQLPQQTGARETRLPSCPSFLRFQLRGILGNTYFESTGTLPASATVTPHFELTRMRVAWAKPERQQRWRLRRGLHLHWTGYARICRAPVIT